MFFHGDRILETGPTGQGTGEKVDTLFLVVNCLHLSAMSHYSLPYGNYKRLDNPLAPNFPDIAKFEQNRLLGWIFKNDGETPLELNDSLKDLFFRA